MKTGLLLLIACLLINCPIVTMNVPNTACVGDTLHLTASATDGTAPYTYQWSGGLMPMTSQQNPTVVLTAVGTYTVSVTAWDKNKCNGIKWDTIRVNNCH